ncbi:hypothetical protein GF340_00525 [Candidatus Peregrinibacteria bacterium]|nr:hypothetical protein [Candidatus Peregrinibacteria bacterium]
MKKIIGTLTLSLVLLAGCANGPKNEDPSANNNNRGSQNRSQNQLLVEEPCQVVTPAEVSEIVGFEVKIDENINTPNTDRSFGCQYISTSTVDNLSFIVTKQKDADTAESTYDVLIDGILASGDDELINISGLGEKANLYPAGRISQLYVLDGELLFTIGLYDNSNSDHESRLKEFASKLLAAM